ncbi:MAG TPA: CPBP family intramembrane glutamic endopeptidase [Bacteroidia bacterium]|nr:CPBP family intramembrane glutamic endopeptidase [Bacteroidia bacterium]
MDTNPFDAPPPAPSEPLHNRFLEAGREGKNEWWRYLIGILIVFLAGYSIVGQIPLLAMALYGHKQGYISIYDEDIASKLLNPRIMHLDPNLVFVVSMFIFVAAMFALWITVRFLHKKRFLSIITSGPRIRWNRFLLSAGIWLILSAAGLYVSMQMDPDNFVFVFNPVPFFITVILALLLLPIQTWWEEFFIRGYIFQGIGLATKTPAIPILITATLFGIVHMMNPEVAKYGVASMLPAYLAPGLFLAMMVALDEGLESAMGMHLVNNLFGTVAVTSSSSAIQANTIWVAKEMDPATDNIGLIGSFLILMLILGIVNKWDIKKLYR